MSIDFDSAALQTQHDEEEYDQEDYAREQEVNCLPSEENSAKVIKYFCFIFYISAKRQIWTWSTIRMSF